MYQTLEAALGTQQAAEQHDLCLQEIQNLETKKRRQSEQIRSPANVEGNTRDLCNYDGGAKLVSKLEKNLIQEMN